MLAKKNWGKRLGPSCEKLGGDSHAKLLVIGGENFGKNFDILNLKSLTWSKVRFIYISFDPVNVLNFHRVQLYRRNFTLTFLSSTKITST